VAVKRGIDMFRVKAKANGGVTSVKMMAKHDMDSGNAKDKNGNVIPAKFLQTVVVKHGENVVFSGSLGTAISKNPYIGFEFNGGAKGDELSIEWIENTGESGTETAKVK